MNRSYLVQTLEMLKPALAATNDPIPIFQCFCFDEGNVSAYNDKIGIIGPTEFEGSCGVHGNTFLGLLSSSRAEEVELNLSKDMELKMGKSVSTLPINEPDSFIFKEPDGEWNEKIQLTQSFMEALELALETVSTDETQQKLHGVTLTKDRLYSCNGDTITRVQVKAPVKSQTQLPTGFCSAVIRLWSTLTMTKGELKISPDWVCAKFDDWAVYGRLLEITDPINWETMIKQTVKTKTELQAVPEDFNEALTRARVLADPESQKTQIKIGKGKARILTATHMGDVDDLVTFKGHPDVTASVNASYLQRALKHCDQISIHENCVVFEKTPNVLMLVSNMDD